MNEPSTRCEAPALTEVEALLLTPDQRRLSDALGSSMPLAAGEIEELVADLRRLELERREAR